VEATAVRITPATAEDWPEIATMRSAYFRQVGSTEYEAPPGIWCVAKEADSNRVLACYSYTTTEQPPQFVITDLYRAPGRKGLRALTKVIELLHEVSESTPVLFIRDPANIDWECAVDKHRARLNVKMIGIVERMG
jgi:hypothetical protein